MKSRVGGHVPDNVHGKRYAFVRDERPTVKNDARRDLLVDGSTPACQLLR